MEKTRLTSDPLFLLYDPILSDIGLRLVEARQSVRGSAVQLDISVCRAADGEADGKDCDRAYHAVYPVAVQEAGPLRDVFLSVSTPGLTRTIRDAHEFSLFTGRTVRVYDTASAAWLSGTVSAFDGETLTLRGVSVGDAAEKREEVSLELAQIQKAKLLYLGEDWKDGR